MLAPEIPANIHQLDRIQRASAAPRSCGCMRRFATKRVLDGDKSAAVGWPVADIEIVTNMNEETDVHILEVTISNKVSLRPEKLFSDSGPEHQRAGKLLALHNSSHGKTRRNAPGNT